MLRKNKPSAGFLMKFFSTIAVALMGGIICAQQTDIRELSMRVSAFEKAVIRIEAKLDVLLDRTK